MIIGKPPTIDWSGLQNRIASLRVIGIGQNMIVGQDDQHSVFLDQASQGPGRDAPMSYADTTRCRPVPAGT